MGWGLGVVLGVGSGEFENPRVGCPGFKGLRNGVRRCAVREDMKENSLGRRRARGWPVSSRDHPGGLGFQNMVFLGGLDGGQFWEHWMEGKSLGEQIMLGGQSFGG